MKKIFIILVSIFLYQSLLAQKAAVVKLNDKFGYINEDGSWLIEPTYLKAGDFHDGLAPVFSGEKWGFIDSNNKLVIDYKFIRAKAFNSGIAIVQEGEKWFYIDKTGEEVKFQINSDKPYDFHDGLAIVKKEGKVGMINNKGQNVIDQKYIKILPFNNGIAKVRLDDKWGFIDTKGNYLLEPKYTKIGKHLSEGVTICREGELWGLLINGEFNVVKVAVKLWDFIDGEKLAAAMTIDKKIGFIDRTGKWIVPPTFIKVREFHNGLAPVYMGEKKWGYVDVKGVVVIDIQFRDGEVFSADGLAPVKLKKLWGFIDKSGVMVIPDDYNITGSKSMFGIEKKGFVNGLVKLSNKDGKFFMNTKGEVLGDKYFQLVNHFTEINK